MIRETAEQDLYSGGRGPTQAQLGLIFTEAGAQAVVAGAGAGKSTSLVSRFLVMNKHLQLPMQNISVFTFTRNSRFDFIDKLVNAAKSWGIPSLTKDVAIKRVRTFHSKALELCRESLPQGIQLYEQLGKAPKPQPGSVEEARFIERQEALADQVDNPYDNSTSSQQLDVLRDVYKTCYETSGTFRDAIKVLLRLAYRSTGQRQRYADEDFEKRGWAAARDSALTAHSEAYWTGSGLWPVEGIEPAPATMTVGDLQFKANGWIRSLNVYVVLGCDSSQSTKVKSDGQTFTPYYSGCSKHNVLLRGSNLTVFFANHHEHFAELRELLEAEQAIKAHEPPVFKVAIPGEWSKVPVFEAIFDLGVFAENMALEPSRLPVAELGRMLSPVEYQTLVAVREFFKTFRDYGAANGLRTFNELFFMLHPGSAYLKKVPLAKLRSMQHLLIDEFQDISPLVVKFVQGIHGELASRLPESDRPSLLVVGDDWQSIYGWRGSAPHFFINFRKLFDGANPRPVLLTDNFRSSQKIIDAAALLIKGTDSAHRIEKACKAMHPDYASGSHPLWVIDDYKPEDAVTIVARLLEVAKHDEEVLVLSRTGKTDSSMRAKCEALLEDGRLRLMTVHKSKGLEADYVLVLDDMYYSGENKLRQSLYGAADFKQTYDDSQRDEARRIGYVAVTRAKRLSVWMAKARDDGVMNELFEVPNVVRRADVGQLLRETD